MATVRSRAARVVRRTLAVPGVLIAVAVAGLLGSPAIAQAAVGTPAATVQHAAASRPAATAQPAAKAAASTRSDPSRLDGHLLGPWYRGHRRPAWLLQRGVQRFNRRPQQHLPAVRPRAGTGDRWN